MVVYPSSFRPGQKPGLFYRDLKMKQCRVFLKSPNGQLKKIYSIRADNKGKFIQTQIWSTLVCKEYGVPLNSDIHYQCPSNGKDFHLSIKYRDLGPFEDPKITMVENYLSFYATRDQYKHKQVIHTTDQKLPGTSHFFQLTEAMKIKFLLGELPDSFAEYKEKKSKYPIRYFPTISTPITPNKHSQKSGDHTNTLPTTNDIIIDESYAPDSRINVCGFFCSPGYYLQKEEAKHRSRVITNPCLPDFGISVIFS